jgi:hypothetical protein
MMYLRLAMVRNPQMLNEFEKADCRGRPADYRCNLAIFEALFAEAAALGIFPLKDLLEGIAVDIRLARAINVRTSA